MFRNSFIFILGPCLLLACQPAGPSEKDGAVTDSTAANATPTPTDASRMKNIVFLGTSLTAGYGLNIAEAYPSLIQQKLDSLKLPYQAVNAGQSGDTSAGGLRRIDWLMQQPIDILFIELGANDGLRGVDPAETRQNLQGIIDKVRAKNPDVQLVIAGMTLPPNLGPAYVKSFEKVFEEIAAKNQAAFLPFLLQGVGGNPKLNQQDGIHPTATGQKILAENAWQVLYPVLSKSAEPS